ncbi:MAG: hypothetical protein U0353_26075 [Sandaracinus sp.]
MRRSNSARGARAHSVAAPLTRLVASPTFVVVSALVVTALVVTTLAGCAGDPSEHRGAHEDPLRCVRCHREDYARAVDPPHEGVRPETCAICHTQRAWRPELLDHPWALAGAHAEAECTDCHASPSPDEPPRFEDTPSQCVDCHADDEAGAFEAHHSFGTHCASCHDTTAWRPAQHPPEPEPEAEPDAGPPLAQDAGLDGGRQRRRPRPRSTSGGGTTGGGTTGGGTTTPEPPPDTTTRSSRRY